MLSDTSRQEFEELYRSDFDKVARGMGRELGDLDAGEEIASRGFVKLWERLNQEPVSDMRALLSKILHDCRIDLIRQLDTRPPVTPMGLLTDDENEELPGYRPPTIQDVEFQTEFDAGLRALPEREREAFILTELRGLTDVETAQLTDVTVRTVYRRLRAARTFLREEITR